MIVGQWKLSYYFLDDERCEKGSVTRGKRDTQHTKSLSAFLRQTAPSSNLAYADFINCWLQREENVTYPEISGKRLMARAF